jgi:hypothetical protein
MTSEVVKRPGKKDCLESIFFVKNTSCFFEIEVDFLVDLVNLNQLFKEDQQNLRMLEI